MYTTKKLVCVSALYLQYCCKEQWQKINNNSSVLFNCSVVFWSPRRKIVIYFLCCNLLSRFNLFNLIFFQYNLNWLFNEKTTLSGRVPPPQPAAMWPGNPAQLSLKQLAIRLNLHFIQSMHRLNLEVDLQSLFGLHVTWCAQLHSLTDTPQLPLPPALGLQDLYTILVSRDRRHLFVTPSVTCFPFSENTWALFGGGWGELEGVIFRKIWIPMFHFLHSLLYPCKTGSVTPKQDYIWNESWK